jgi:ABC-type nickel/cobalt efflux system permease component RcnA
MYSHVTFYVILFIYIDMLYRARREAIRPRQGQTDTNTYTQIHRAKVKGDQQAAPGPHTRSLSHTHTHTHRAKVRGDQQVATAELVGAGLGKKKKSQKYSL